MKLLDYSIVFLCIVTALLLPSFMSEQESMAYSRYGMQYHARLDHAIDDGLFAMMEQDTGERVILNRNRCVETFYQSFFANFGMLDDVQAQERIKHHIPCIGIVEQGRVSFLYREWNNQNGENELVDTWSAYIPYEYEEGGYRYRFFVGSKRDTVIVYIPSKNEWVEGTRDDLARQGTEFLWLRDQALFEQIRRNTIMKVIKESMEDLLTKQNLFAQQYGWNYHTYIPEGIKQDWCRTIDDIGMIVLFQGYPVKGTLGKTYTRFVFSGARTYKNERSS